ncbi:MAG: hypothetical protein ACYC6L_08580 [Anaerolineae bacterium]
MRDIPGQRVSRFGALVTIAVTAALLAWFDFFPRYVGFLTSTGGLWSVYPVLLPEFNRYKVGLNIWWIAAILLNLVHLGAGRWLFMSWLADVLLKVYGILLFMRMVVGPAFITPDWLSPIIKIVLALTAFGLTVSLVVQVIAFARATAQGDTRPPDESGPVQYG